jgi:histidinol phosphatase-like enzyme
MTRLIPGRYLCRKHDHDLTSAVLSKVDSDPSVVVNLGHRTTDLGLAEIGSFTVDVDCPGSDKSHTLRFMGSFERND